MDRTGIGHLEPLLDHLVYATPDLAATVADFTRDTGVTPAEGGRHLGRGTRNFLVSLGPERYLEIIGPDLENAVAAGVGLPFGVEELDRPRLLTFAVHPVDIEAACAVTARAGADLGPPLAMSRRTPSGELLSWRLASAVPLPFGGVTPFLIDWGQTPHPAAAAALPTLVLAGFSATHPDPDAVQRVLIALGLFLPVGAGPPSLTAVLDTPNGEYILS